MFQGLKSIAPGYSGALLCHPPMKRKGRIHIYHPLIYFLKEDIPFPFPQLYFLYLILDYNIIQIWLIVIQTQINLKTKEM